MADIAVTREIAAPPERIWALVSDITRTGEWSPESTGGTWLGGATGPEVGARFKGTNQSGGRRWSTTGKVTECVPGERFTFEVVVGPIGVATWSYDLRASATETSVTQSWTDDRHPLVAKILGPVTGVRDRAAHNRQNIERSLEGLDRVATSTTS